MNKLKLKKLLKAIYQRLQQLLLYDLRLPGSLIYPHFINYPVTDKCDSKCVMCNIWKTDKIEDLSVEKLHKILKDPLFKKVKSVGLSGGEPSLRDDLADLGRTIITALPNLTGLSIIDNGLQSERVVRKIAELSDTCLKLNKKLSVMISLDGIGSAHDKVRGISKAFEKTTNTIDLLKKNEHISLALCCTINRYNVYDLNRILNYAKSQGLYIKFRMATNIDRLYNQDCQDDYSLNQEQKHIAGQFLEKLGMTYESDWERILFYRSLRKMLTEGSERTAPCVWQKDGVTLDAKGNLYYCAVKSRTLGDAKTFSAKQLYFDSKNLQYRQGLVNKECAYCIHDYTTSFTNELFKEFFRRIYRKIVTLPINMYCLRPWAGFMTMFLKKERVVVKKTLKKIMIIGWYGTETTGDKAILAGIIKDFKNKFGKVEITVLSYHPFYTLRTIEEIKAENVTVISITSYEWKPIWKTCDLIIMGGGPLMDIPEVLDVLKIFFKSRLAGKVTMLYGVGIGPLNDERIKQAVRTIIKLADIVVVRDKRSERTLRAMGVSKKINVGVDPAISYLLEYKATQTNTRGKVAKKVGLALRSLPKNYTQNLSDNEFNEKKEKLLTIFKSTIQYLVEILKVDVTLIPMNTFYVGDDDRDILESLESNFGEKVSILQTSGSPDDVAGAIAEQDFFIGMRFHSVVFSAALGVPVIALDYTAGKGKISGFMEGINQHDRVIEIDRLTTDNMKDQINRLTNSLDEVGKQLVEISTIFKEKTQVAASALESWFECKSI